MPGAVEDRQEVYDERRRNSGQEKKQQQQIARSRSTGPVDRRARGAQVVPRLTGRPDRSTGVSLQNFQSSLFVTGRPDRSTGESL